MTEDRRLTTPNTAELVDVSCFVGPWPFRGGLATDPAQVKRALRRVGVTHALVSPASILHRTPDAANQMWSQAVAGDPFFAFVPVVDPTCASPITRVRAAFPDARAVRIMPGPHGYPLDAATGLAALAAQNGLSVIVQWRMLDVRMAHPQAVFDDPDVAAVHAFVSAAPDTRFVLAGALREELVDLLARGLPPNVWYDVSFAEGLGLLHAIGDGPDASRVLCGSHAPIHAPAALAAKFTAEPLDPDTMDRYGSRNAEEAGLVASR